MQGLIDLSFDCQDLDVLEQLSRGYMTRLEGGYDEELWDAEGISHAG